MNIYKSIDIWLNPCKQDFLKWNKFNFTEINFNVMICSQQQI